MTPTHKEFTGKVDGSLACQTTGPYGLACWIASNTSHIKNSFTNTVSIRNCMVVFVVNIVSDQRIWFTLSNIWVITEDLNTELSCT